MDGEDQSAASKMSEMDTPLDHAQDEAMPLVEWALTPMGHCNPEEEYANVMASTNHLEILCFVTGPPLVWLPKPTKSCSDFLYEAKRSMYILRALTGQSRDSWLLVGVGGHGKHYNLGSGSRCARDKQGLRKGPAGVLLA